MIKRLFDIVFSFLGLTILSPLFIILMILISCSSKGGPFFCGPRVGKNGKMFKIIKFRSMKKDCEGKGKWNVGDKDPRITKMGHFLRKTKLDELPQLINVLIGQMSFVGYRPELKFYIDMYTDKEKPILDLKPGITDWASMVNMKQFEGFTKADDPDEYYLNVVRPLKLELQLYYRYHHNIFSDFYILLLTALKVFTRSNKLPRKIQSIVSNYYLNK